MKIVSIIIPLHNAEAYILETLKSCFEQIYTNIEVIVVENGIAILRMDADWYDSTMDILTNFFPQINKGGVIIIDDYYHWEGCTRAVHDYLSRHECTEAITSTSFGVCFIVKK